MKIVRTPDERFDGLPDWPYEPHYVEVTPPTAPGCASSTSTRAPGDAAPGALHARRAVVVLPLPQHDPGRSSPPGTASSPRTWWASAAPTSRPSRTTTPTPATSTGCAVAGRALDLRDITLVCQDWGGLIGLRLVAEHPDRFARVVVANTFLPTGDQPPGRGVPRLAAVLPGGRGVRQRVRGPDGHHHRAVRRGHRRLRSALPRRHLQGRRRAASRCWCRRPPTIPRRRPNRAAWEVLERWDKPFLTAFSDRTPITAGRRTRSLQKRDPGAPASPTPPSRAAATSSRRTAALSSPAPSATSSTGPPTPGRPADRRALRPPSSWPLSSARFSPPPPPRYRSVSALSDLEALYGILPPPKRARCTA